jgi:hypothetical protein
MKRMSATRSNDNIIKEQNFKVPADIVMDILQVVFNYRVNYNINEVNADDGYLMLTINSKGQSRDFTKAVENIGVLLNEYNDFEKLCATR